MKQQTTRIFDEKRYKWAGVTYGKASARNNAKELRAEGYFVRITPGASLGRSRTYNLWKRVR